MSCCDGWDNGPAVGECPDCGEPADEDGYAVEGCLHSPIQCNTCGAAPCDQYC